MTEKIHAHGHAPAPAKDAPANAAAKDAPPTAFAAITKDGAAGVYATAEEARAASASGKCVDVDPAVWPTKLPATFKPGEPGYEALADAVLRFGK
jgi:hypothetical protein